MHRSRAWWRSGLDVDRTARAVGLRVPRRSALRIRDIADRHQRRIGARGSGWRWWGGSGRRGRGCHGTGGSADDRAGCPDREPLTLLPVCGLVRLLAALLRARSTSARASLSALRRRRARPRREGAAGGWALAREPSALPPRAAAARASTLSAGIVRDRAEKGESKHRRTGSKPGSRSHRVAPFFAGAPAGPGAYCGSAAAKGILLAAAGGVNVKSASAGCGARFP